MKRTSRLIAAMAACAIVACGGGAGGGSSDSYDAGSQVRGLDSGETAIYFTISLGSEDTFMQEYGISYTTSTYGIVRYVPGTGEVDLVGTKDSTSSTPRKYRPYTANGKAYLVSRNTDTGTTYLETEYPAGVFDGFSDLSYNDVDERMLVRVGYDTFYRTERETDLFGSYVGGDIMKNGSVVIPYGDGENYLTDAEPDFVTANGKLYSMYKQDNISAVIERSVTDARIVSIVAQYSHADHAEYDAVWKAGAGTDGAYWAVRTTATGEVNVYRQAWDGSMLEPVFSDSVNGGSSIASFDVDGTIALIAYASGEMVLVDTVAETYTVHDLGVYPRDAEVQSVR